MFLLIFLETQFCFKKRKRKKLQSVSAQWIVFERCSKVTKISETLCNLPNKFNEVTLTITFIKGTKTDVNFMSVMS